MSGRCLVVGVGNWYRRDDGVGLWVARALAEIEIETEMAMAMGVSVTIQEASGEGASLMASWQGYDTVILIDAVQAGGEPGTLYAFAAHETSLPTSFFNYSTHAFSVAEAVEMARVLGLLPSRLWVYGIEGESFATGEGLSTAVQQTATTLIPQLHHKVTRLTEIDTVIGGTTMYPREVWTMTELIHEVEAIAVAHHAHHVESITISYGSEATLTPTDFCQLFQAAAQYHILVEGADLIIIPHKENQCHPADEIVLTTLEII